MSSAADSPLEEESLSPMKTNKDPPENVRIARATRKDTEEIYELVNAAFEIELGIEGLAYRQQNRFVLKDQVRKCIDDILVVKDQNKVSWGGFFKNIFGRL